MTFSKFVYLHQVNQNLRNDVSAYDVNVMIIRLISATEESPIASHFDNGASLSGISRSSCESRGTLEQSRLAAGLFAKQQRPDDHPPATPGLGRIAAIV